jgi:uncharacterized protein involved in type VI secretion and phage assembly
MGMDEQTFAVINFKGYKSISKPYESDILLVSNEMELDLDDVLNSSAQFLIRHTESADQIKAGQMSHTVEDLYSMDSKYTIMVSKKDTKIDGEHIHIG